MRVSKLHVVFFFCSRYPVLKYVTRSGYIVTAMTCFLLPSFSVRIGERAATVINVPHVERPAKTLYYLSNALGSVLALETADGRMTFFL